MSLGSEWQDSLREILALNVDKTNLNIWNQVPENRTYVTDLWVINHNEALMLRLVLSIKVARAHFS